MSNDYRAGYEHAIRDYARGNFDFPEARDPDTPPWDDNGVYLVIGHVLAERERQDIKWGGPEHDDTHRAYHWSSYIEQRLHSGDHLTAAESRQLFIEIAALAVAAVESIDRKARAE